jgi:hypothetical protein
MTGYAEATPVNPTTFSAGMTVVAAAGIAAGLLMFCVPKTPHTVTA